MHTYALIFRMNLSPEAQPSPEQMAIYMARWGEWIASIQAEGRLEDGNHFLPSGAVLRRGGAVEMTPYVAGKESVAGYLLVQAKNLQDAMRIASTCPILEGEGTSVEVREAAPPMG